MADYELPKYLYIKQQIEKLLNQGDIKPGTRIPTEHQLADKFDASRHTVRKALNLLKQEGVLYKKQGVGTFYREKGQELTGNIGFISISLYDYIFADMLNGIDSVFHEEGYQILVGNSRDDQEREQEILEKFLKKNIDGLVIEPAKSAYNYPNIELLERFTEKNIPVVLLDSSFDNEKFSYITVDDIKGGWLATRYFIDSGHRRIAIIYKAWHKPAVNRFKGYERGLKEEGIPVLNDYVKPYYNSEFEEPEMFEEEIRQLTEQLLNLEDRPSAIFCFNDQIAILVKEILLDNGLQVPGDVSIIGYDDSDIVQLDDISITSIAHPRQKSGEKAAEIILENIEHRQGYTEFVTFEPKLIERNSVKKMGDLRVEGGKRDELQEA